MENRYGIDFILSEDGDLIFKSNGDVMTTADYENQKGDAKFVGYYNVVRSILNRLISNRYDYPFDPGFGEGIEQYLSQPITPEFANNMSTLVSESLSKDDRISKVISVTTEIIAREIVIIRAQVKLTGDDTVSDLIFPRMYIS